MPVGRRLVEGAMAEHDLTIARLGLRLGISRKHISNVLAGKVPLGEALAERLADALDLDADELLDLRHDGVVPPSLADAMPMAIEIIGDPTEPIPGWFED